jgi:hypothetical protein
MIMETTTTINRQKFTALKNEIKSLTKNIRATKVAYKESQRKKDSPWVVLANLQSFKYEARHKLIAYSLAKGRDYGCVEKRVHEGNEPDWAYIRRLQDELAS